MQIKFQNTFKINCAVANRQNYFLKNKKKKKIIKNMQISFLSTTRPEFVGVKSLKKNSNESFLNERPNDRIIGKEKKIILTFPRINFSFHCYTYIIHFFFFFFTLSIVKCTQFCIEIKDRRSNSNE